MKVFNVDRVVVRYLNENGTYSAESVTGNSLYNDCIFVTPYPDIVAYEMIGKHALMMIIDNQNFILGYYIDEYEKGRDQIYLEGEKLFKLGEGRGFILGDDGYVGIYNYKVGKDGQISRTPKFEINAKDEVYAAFSSMLMSMSDSSVTHTVDKDGLGYNKVKDKVKGRNNDMGPRYESTIEGTVFGMKYKFAMDLGAGPTRTIPPLVPISLLPDNISIASSPLSPLDIIVSLIDKTKASIKINKLGAITISTGAIGGGPQVKLDPKAPGSVIIKNDMAGTGMIKITKTGKVVISAMTGVEIKGAAIELMATLLSFMQQDYAVHVHPSAMGPTGTPLPLAGAPTIANLSAIKGV